MRKTDKKKQKKNNIPGKIDLDEEELVKIKTISEYLFMDQYQDSATYPRFEECFGAFCLEKKIDLPKVYKILCGKKRKYLTFRRLISSYNQWKKNPNKHNEDYKKFMDLVYKNLLKEPGEEVGKITDKAICFNTDNSQHKKAISQFCVITDEDQDVIKGFQITYDDFFKNNLFLNKENEKFYVSLELNLASDTPTTETAEESFPDMNYRDGITHLGGTIKDGKINFLVFKCRSGKTAFVGKPSGDPFLFGAYSEQLLKINIAVKDGSLIYLKPDFVLVERNNPKINKNSEEITENFLKQDKPVYEETILENVTNEEEVEKNILEPIMKDDRFYDRLKHTDKITGRPFFQIYPAFHKFIRYDPMSGKINIHVNPVDLITEAANFIANRHQILEQVKKILQPKNFLSGLGTLLLGNQEANMSPGEVLQNPVSLTNFLGDMFKSVEESARAEGKKGIVKGIFSGAVSGLSNLLSGQKETGPKGIPPFQQQDQTEYIPPNNMDNNNNFPIEFNNEIIENTNFEQNYTDSQLYSSKKDKKEKGEKDDKKDPSDRLKGKLPFGLGGGGGIGGVLNVMNNVAQNFFGIGFGGGGGGISSMFSPFGFSGPDYYSQGNNYYYDDYYQQEEKRRKETERIQRQHEEEMRKKMSEEIIKKKTLMAQKLWRYYYDKYAKDQGIFLLQTIGAVIRGLNILKREKMGQKTNCTYEEKQKILNILQNNKNIILMLIRARQEAQRRRMEEEMMKNNQKELEKMRIEEENRKMEEKKRIEEEKRRIEQEKKILEEKKKI